MIYFAGIAMGIIIAALGYKHGLYTMWAVMFNCLIAIFLGVMLSPTLASYFEWFGSGFSSPSSVSFWYLYAACVAGVAVVAFFILQIAALTWFTGTFNITLPRIVNTIGSAFLGFITGYVIWGFICFVVIIMPAAHTNIFLKAFTADAQSRRISTPAVSKVVNTVAAFSFQPDVKKVCSVISFTLGWDEPQLNDSNAPESIESTDTIAPAPAPVKPPKHRPRR